MPVWLTRFYQFTCGWVNLTMSCCFSWVLQCWFRELDEWKFLSQLNNFLLDSIFKALQKQPSLSVQGRKLMGRHNFLWWPFTLRLVLQYHKPVSQRAAFKFCCVFLGGCVLTVPNKKFLWQYQRVVFQTGFYLIVTTLPTANFSRISVNSLVLFAWRAKAALNVWIRALVRENIYKSKFVPQWVIYWEADKIIMQPFMTGSVW